MDKFTDRTKRIAGGILFAIGAVTLICLLALSDASAALGSPASMPAEWLAATGAPFAAIPRLASIAQAVRPENFIADRVLPRVRTAAQFKYTEVTTRDQLTVVDTRIGRTGNLNRVEFRGTLKDGSTKDYGLEDAVPKRDIDYAMSQDSTFDPWGEAVMGTMHLVKLAQEKRVADLLGDATTYAADLNVTLAGDGKWSSNKSNPHKAILAAMDTMLVRPNTLVLSQGAWTALRTHSKVVSAVKGGVGGDVAEGVLAKMQIAELLELKEIIVGEPWHQSANAGQAEAYTRLWGNMAALIHIDSSMTTTKPRLPVFGFTAEWMGPTVATYEEEGRGVSGSTIIKVTDCVDEVISYQRAGYLFRTPV